MKYFFATIVLVMWMLCTLLLAITLIGIIIITEEEWSSIPLKIIKVLSK